MFFVHCMHGRIWVGRCGCGRCVCLQYMWIICGVCGVVWVWYQCGGVCVVWCVCVCVCVWYACVWCVCETEVIPRPTMSFPQERLQTKPDHVPVKQTRYTSHSACSHQVFVHLHSNMVRSSILTHHSNMVWPSILTQHSNMVWPSILTHHSNMVRVPPSSGEQPLNATLSWNSVHHSSSDDSLM